MKKRILAMLLAGSMIFGLAACSGGSDAEESTPAGTDTDETAPVETDGVKTVKVGLICIGDENDQGYTYNFIRGQEAATEALAAKGINVEWSVKWNIGEDSLAKRPTSSWPKRAASSSSTTPLASRSTC